MTLWRWLTLIGLLGLVFTAFPAGAQALPPGAIFVDCEVGCPQMVVIPPGEHVLGPYRSAPQAQETVVFTKSFAIGRFEITFADWDACVADGGCLGVAGMQDGEYYEQCRSAWRCSSNPLSIAGNPAFDEGWGRGRRPLINVNQSDIEQFLHWLSWKSGRSYRLPSAAEWSYSGAGGQRWAAASGDDWRERVNMGRYIGRTLPVGTYPPNAFGLFDMLGNVNERVASCSENLMKSDRISECDRLRVFGGSWTIAPVEGVLDTPGDFGFRQMGVRTWGDGFRVARDL